MANRYVFASNPLNSKNIKFLSGTQSSLNTMIANRSATEGTFYLTTDTHRLYIGRAITKDGDTNVTNKAVPIPISEGIQKVANVAALENVVPANEGEFYYAIAENILAVYNGTTWVQVNPDTDTNTWEDTAVISTGTGCTSEIIYKATTDTSVVSGKTYYTKSGNTYTAVTTPASNPQTAGYYESDYIKYTLTIAQKKYHSDGQETDGGTVTVEFGVRPQDVANVLDIAAGLSRSVTSGQATISIDGDLNNGKNVVLTGSGGTTITGAGTNQINIASKTYALTSPAITSSDTTKQLILQRDSATASTVEFQAGDNLKIANTGSSAQDDKIKYIHTTPGAAVTQSGTSNVAYAGDNSNGQVNFGSSFKVPRISRDKNGHIVSISDVTLSLPSVTSLEGQAVTSVEADEYGFIKIGLANGQTISSGNNNNGDLYYTMTVDGTLDTYPNQSDLGSFYSASKVDEKIATALKGINAMVYKGTVGNASSTVGSSILPSSNVSIGDTYLVNNAGNVTTGTNTTVLSRIGDLFIATGSEDSSTGYIDGTITWTHVEAGDVDTTYTFSNTGDTIVLSGSNSYSNSVKIAGSDWISTSGTAGQITISHGNAISSDATAVTPTASDTAPSGTNPTALTHGGIISIPRFSYDAKGHIASSGIETFALPSLPAAHTFKINNYANSAGTGDPGTYIRLWEDNSSTTVAIAGGDKLTASATANTITLSHDTSGVVSGNTENLVVGAGSNGNINTETAILAYNGDFVVPTIKVDKYGHVIAAGTKTLTMPARPTIPEYTLKSSQVTTSGTLKQWTTRLFKDSSSVGDFTYQSNTLDIGDSAASTTGDLTSRTFTIDLKWGTF